MSFPSSAVLNTQGFGNRPENVEIPFYSVVAPASTNVNFPLGKRWITSSGEYVLTSFTSSNGALIANWTGLGASGLVIDAAGVSNPMVAGLLTVTNSKVTSSSIIIYSGNTLNNPGIWGLQGQTTGSFQITSDNSADTSTFNYIVVNV